jgi:hypothetical protein
MRSCGPPRCDGGARVAQTVANDSEIVGEQAVAEEVLVLEATAISSSLERVLDVAAGKTVLRRGSEGNGGGQWWRSLARKCGLARVEQR